MIPATPATVAPITNGAFMRHSSCREGLCVDPVPVHPERPDGTNDVTGKSVRPTDIDVSTREVWYEAPQLGGVEAHHSARSDDGPEVTAPALQEGFHLIGQNGFVLIRCAQQRDDIDTPREILNQGAQRGHPEAGPGKGYSIRRARVLCEGPVGPFDGDEGPRTQARQLGTVVSKGFDGNAHIRRLGHGRKRGGGRLPPQPSSQEPPLQELSAVDGKTLEVLAPHDDRDATGDLSVDATNLEPVIAAAPQRH